MKKTNEKSTMDTAITFEKTPPVFSFQRGALVTDGAFFNLIDGRFEDHPLQVIRHGIRGVISVADSDNTAKGADRPVNNIQQTESAKTDDRAEALVARFGLRMLDLRHALHACAAKDVKRTNEVRASVNSFVERARSSKGLEEVSNRIARNVANGSWLWRNRVQASELTVEVHKNGVLILSFDGLATPMNHFDGFSSDELALGKILADGLRGDTTASLEVRAIVKFGLRGALEVYASQAFIEKVTGFSRALYKINLSQEAHDPTAAVRIMGQAALRDQKISNRLRTIDTWYDDYALVGKPIPIEPNGANLEFMQFFRSSKQSGSAFDLFARLNSIDPDSNEGMYCIGVLIRGGVLGGGSEAAAPKAGKSEPDADDAASSDATKGA